MEDHGLSGLNRFLTREQFDTENHDDSRHSSDTHADYHSNHVALRSCKDGRPEQSSVHEDLQGLDGLKDCEHGSFDVFGDQFC